MKKYLLFLIFTVALICMTSPASALENPANYYMVKIGIYAPSKSYNLNNFNSGSTTHLDSKSGINGEVAMGHYFLPVFAVELGSGFFESKGSPAAEPGSARLKVVPVLATAKVFLPVSPGRIELYGEFGIGAYFTKYEVNDNLGSFSTSSEITYGVHSGVGVNFNITDDVFLGVEGRYRLATQPSFGGQKIPLDGFTTTVAVGFRF